MTRKLGPCGHSFCCRRLLGEEQLFASRSAIPSTFSRLWWEEHCIIFSQEAF